MSQDIRQPSADPQNTQKNAAQPCPQRVPLHRRIGRKVQAIPLSTKLVTCIIVLLTIGTIGISFSIRTLVGNYLLQKTDNQLVNQAQMIFNSMDSLDSTTSEDGRSLVNTYYVEVRDSEYKRTGAGSVPMLREGVVSEPSLPSDGSIDGVTLGEPFTTQAVVHVTTSRVPDHAIMQAAQSPWRVVALPWSEKSKAGEVKNSGVVFIGLSLSDQIDTANTLTRFCAMVGIAVVLIGVILGTIVVQSTLAPLKRIEKTAAKIAAGDLSQRVPDLPENTEVGSLSMSLNTMLTRIEESFHAQEETTEKMKRFVSDASHELRTPVTTMRMASDLLEMKKDGFDPSTKRTVELLAGQISRFQDMLADLLEISRYDAGYAALDLVETDLCEPIETAVDQVAGIAQAKRVPIHTYLPNVQVLTRIDSRRVIRIVRNLLANAVDFAEDRPIEVRVAANRKAVAISVRDYGVGIDEDKVAHVFDRFWRSDPSRSRVTGGTGLGLAIAMTDALLHHGTIRVRSAVGEGTWFLVLLPRDPDQGEVADAELPVNFASETPDDLRITGGFGVATSQVTHDYHEVRRDTMMGRPL